MRIVEEGRRSRESVETTTTRKRQEVGVDGSVGWQSVGCSGRTMSRARLLRWEEMGRTKKSLIQRKWKIAEQVRRRKGEVGTPRAD
jgi:hypothetical protein